MSRIFASSDFTLESEISYNAMNEHQVEPEPTEEEIRDCKKARRDRSVPAMYTSIWSSGVRIDTPCRYDKMFKTCFDIEVMDIYVGNATLSEEFVTVEMLVNVELRTSDDVTFEY